MMLKAFSIYDNKALQYHPPFFASTNQSATRMLSDLANDSNTNVGRHPSDYVLYCVGHYNDQNGHLEAYSPLEHVVDAISLLSAQSQLFNGVK